MTRRNQQGQQQLRRAKKQVEQSLGAEQGRYRPPPREDCKPRQWETPIDDAPSIRVQYNIWRHKGCLVDFAINIQVLTAEAWETVESFDCCHGNCHYHPVNGEEPRPLAKLDVVGDVQHSYWQVESVIADRVRIIMGRVEG
ncbi:hypothetical protein MB901379_03879 [Mycobacterium basiliense]|uniref:Uncharacterized protein n=1 Tax=Mycobacterium basiliense TaxID=2094119 RepID=A0A447GII8_9MYCO|nr:hypothetical protein [Mycobacterium basiliense]VDM90283.1 hypothetical protein MB901379_03879 [Mycobacterium basiliense]